MRLNRFLAAAGVGSRRHCDQLIADGRVTINGRVCTDFSTQPAEGDHVKVGNKLVRSQQHLYVILNKPAGFVSTRADPNVRDKIFDLLPNDGDLAQRLTHPRYKVEKEYEVTLDRPWDPALAPKLLAGMMLDGERARMDKVQAIRMTRVRVVLRQGINRQIRRMFYELGFEVKKLVRVRVGHLRLGDLPRGYWRPLTRSELKSLQPDSARARV